jgi:hypothetical protein
MPRTCSDGITHLMGLDEDSLAWVLRCRPSWHSKGWDTRPGVDIDCMACLGEPDGAERRFGDVIRIRRRRDPDDAVHEAWTTGDFDARTTCGLFLYLPVDQQTQDPTSCPSCLRPLATT